MEIKQGSPSHSDRLLLGALFFSSFAAMPTGIVIGLLLIDVAASFNVSVGVAGQIGAFGSVSGFVMALVMGVLSIRFGQRSLLLAGLSVMAVSALGCALSPSLVTLILAFSCSQIGLAIVMPMRASMVGTYFPPDKRASAMGVVIAGASMSYAVGAPLAGYLGGIGGWRLAILAYAFPVILFGLLLSLLFLPKTSSSAKPSGGSTYRQGFKEVLRNVSAVASLVGYALTVSSWQAILYYGSSFYRQQLGVPTIYVSFNILGAALLFTLGSLTSAKMIRRLGTKTLTVIFSSLLAAAVLAFTNIMNLWISLIFYFAGCLFSGLRSTSSSTLSLEQAPKFRGTMMSLFAAAEYVGTASGTSIGGFALLASGYQLLGLILAAIGFVSAFVFQVLAKETRHD